jgi:hypothetical protein
VSTRWTVLRFDFPLIFSIVTVSSDFVVSPRTAAVPPAIEDLRDRFGSSDLFDLEILSQDLEEESRQLAGMDGLNDTVVSDLTARAVNANSG